MRAIRLAVMAGMMAAMAGWAGAELCPTCKGKAYIKSLGECVECGGITTSGAFKLCMKCSRKLNQCEHCRAALGAAKAALDYGNHTSGKWEYRYSIANQGTRSEGTFGKLLYDGKEVPDGTALNDHYSTPWGVLFWVGNQPMPFGAHGWMQKPSPRAGAGMGNLLPDPSGQPVRLVWAKVLTSGKADDEARTEKEAWILEELKKLGVESAMVDRGWFVLSAQPLCIHDTKRYGQASVSLDEKSGKDVVVNCSTGEKAELAGQNGARKVARCTLKSTMGTLDLYLAIRVEAAGEAKEQK